MIRGREKWCIQGLGGAMGSLRERNHFEDLGVNGIIILKWILTKWGRNMNWNYLTEDRDRRRAVVNAVMNLRVPQNVGNFLSI